MALFWRRGLAQHLKSQFATSSWGGRRKLPLAFSEHGAIMAATVLNSPRAVEVSVYVVRAFVRLRELAVTHGDLGKRLDELEQKTEALAMNHDTFSRNTATRALSSSRCSMRCAN
jgi:hypothetical protein